MDDGGGERGKTGIEFRLRGYLDHSGNHLDHRFTVIKFLRNMNWESMLQLNLLPKIVAYGSIKT